MGNSDIPTPVFTETNPACGSSTNNIIHGGPNAGLIEWTVQAEDAAPLTFYRYMAMRISPIPPSGIIQGQLFTWQDSWMNFTSYVGGTDGIDFCGDNLFLPNVWVGGAPVTYTMQAKIVSAAALDGYPIGESNVATCTLTITAVDPSTLAIETERVRVRPEEADE